MIFQGNRSLQSPEKVARKPRKLLAFYNDFQAISLDTQQLNFAGSIRKLWFGWFYITSIGYRDWFSDSFKVAGYMYNVHQLFSKDKILYIYIWLYANHSWWASLSPPRRCCLKAGFPHLSPIKLWKAVGEDITFFITCVGWCLDLFITRSKTRY